MKACHGFQITQMCATTCCHYETHQRTDTLLSCCILDDYAFRRPEPIPLRVDLKTGTVRALDMETFKGRGGKIPGGAAIVLDLALNPDKKLKSLTVRTLANEVVIGLMAVTLTR